MIYVFFDQNVKEKLSKKKYKLFQDNVNRILLEKAGNKTERITPFSILEFSGYNLKNLDLKYKNKELNEYPFESYAELIDLIDEKKPDNLKKQISSEITKSFLKNKLEEKRKKSLNYLNDKGFGYIDQYIKLLKDSFFYKNLINNLFFDRLSQVNISQFSLEDKDKFRGFFTKFVIHSTCERDYFGDFRLVCKFFEEIEKINTDCFDKQSETYNTIKEIKKITERVKAKGDLLDCELLNLAFFGGEDNICHCYTTDKKEVIEERLKLYCYYIEYSIRFFKYLKNRENTSSKIIKNNEYPEWKCGKVFILNRDTGEKIKKISVTKIYEETNPTNKNLFDF